MKIGDYVVAKSTEDITRNGKKSKEYLSFLIENLNTPKKIFELSDYFDNVFLIQNTQNLNFFINKSDVIIITKETHPEYFL